jgi:hypothetical protein
MSELDKFKGKGLPATSTGTEVTRTVERARLPWEGSTPTPSSTAEGVLNSKRGHFAIALDGTASMTPLIDMTKVTIKRIMSRVIAEAKAPVKVQLFVYRDYDVARLLVEQSRLSAEANELAGWLNGIGATGGGANNGEAIEQALLAIQRAGEFDAVLVAGDEPYNSRAHLDQLGKRDVPTAADLARRFGQSKCPIHTFLVGSYPDARKALQELASTSGGCFGQLDGSEAMIDMAVLAMLAGLKGKAFVKDYMERTALSHGGKNFGALLLKGPGS